MPTPIRSVALAIAAALLLGACLPDAQSQPAAQPATQPDPPSAQTLACSGPADTVCGPNAYCRVTTPGAGGVCTPRPQMCPMIYQPVCGEDGKTYANSCHAGRAGVNAVHPGACGK
jgi:hypothetical protein